MMNKALTYYLAGPMSGIPQFNFPLFHSAAKHLRAQGFKLVSPAEQDSKAVQDEAMKSKTGSFSADGKVGGETWGDMLSRDVKLVSDQVDGIIVLPNWFTSRGARLEVFVGLLCKKQFGWYDDMTETALSLSIDNVRTKIKEYMP